MTDLTQLTPAQQVQKDYVSAMDSVNLLKAGKPADWKGTDAEWADVVKRNKDHLHIQIAKGATYYGTNDLTPFTQAVA